MKIYLKYIFLFLIAGSIFSSCNQKDEKVYSFWALQNRATGEYLYEDDGECKFSREKQGDKSLWKIAAAEGDHVCIVNKKSGRYLSLDNGQVVCSVVDQPVTESAEWYYGNFDFVTQTNSGWYTISNRSAESNLHLVEKDGTLCMQDNANRNTDFSAHWTWVREEGTPLSYSFTPDGVTDASFLGIRTAKAISPTEIHSDYHGEKVWKLSQDISSFPKFSTENINPEKRNEPSCKNEVVQNLQKRSVQKSTSAQYKKSTEKTYFFGAFLLLCLLAISPKITNFKQ